MAHAVSLQPLTLVLDWFPNPDQAPIWTAQAQHYFAQQGLKVTIIAPAMTNDPIKFVAAGKADVAITYQPQLVLSTVQGLPIVRIATLINRPLGCLITQQNIGSLKQLAGKTIGYSSPGVDEAILSVMLHSVGLTTKDVTLINVNYDLVQALLTKRVAAVMNVQRNFEQIALAEKHFPDQVFYPEQHGVPLHDEFIIVTNKKLLTDKRLPKFLKALQQGMDYLQQHPHRSWQLFIAAHPEANNNLNRQSWFMTLPDFAKQIAPFDPTRYAQFTNFMYQQHLIKSIPKLADYAVVLQDRAQ